MTVTQVNQVDLNHAAQDLAPDVVYIRADVGTDWVGDPAIHFRIILADDIDLESLGALTTRISSFLREEFQPSDQGLLSYFDYRGLSEQQALDDPEWR